MDSVEQTTNAPPSNELRSWLKVAVAAYLGNRVFPEPLIQRLNQRHLVELFQVEFGDNHMTAEEMLVYIRLIFPNNLRRACAVLCGNLEFHKFIEAKCRRVTSTVPVTHHTSTVVNHSVPFRVACFGCGPGSECIALMKFLRSGSFKCRVHFQLYDLNDWSDSLAFFLTDYATSTGQALTSAFFKTDVLSTEFISVTSNTLKNIDLFLFSKFACEIHTSKKKGEFYDALFSVAKHDSFFVLIDRRFKYQERSDILSEVENVAQRYGFRVCASSFLGIVFGEEINAEKGKSCVFRFLQKLPIAQDNSLQPTWSKRSAWKIDPAAKSIANNRRTSTDSFTPDFIRNLESPSVPAVIVDNINASS